MKETKKNPTMGVAGFQESSSDNGHTKSVRNKSTTKLIPCKLDTMLRRFAQGEKHHRFTAEQVADHCLHSTIASLQKKHGIYFDRMFIKVRNRFGTDTHVKLYWLEGENLEKARKAAGLDRRVAA